jgi:hypothetical protein
MGFFAEVRDLLGLQEDRQGFVRMGELCRGVKAVCGERDQLQVRNWARGIAAAARMNALQDAAAHDYGLPPQWYDGSLWDERAWTTHKHRWVDARWARD